MRTIMASWINATLEVTHFSKSRHNLLKLSSHAKVRSTIHRFDLKTFLRFSFYDFQVPAKKFFDFVNQFTSIPLVGKYFFQPGKIITIIIELSNDLFASFAIVLIGCVKTRSRTRGDPNGRDLKCRWQRFPLLHCWCLGGHRRAGRIRLFRRIFRWSYQNHYYRADDHRAGSPRIIHDDNQDDDDENHALVPPQDLCPPALDWRPSGFPGTPTPSSGYPGPASAQCRAAVRERVP